MQVWEMLQTEGHTYFYITIHIFLKEHWLILALFYVCSDFEYAACLTEGKLALKQPWPLIG